MPLTAPASDTAAAMPTIGDELARNSLISWAGQFSGPQALLELGLVLLMLFVLWGALRALKRGLDYDNPDSVLFGRHIYDGVLLPLLAVGLLAIVQPMLARVQPVLVLPLASALLTSLLLIQLGVKVLKAAFPGKAWVQPISRSISWLIWGWVALWIVGLGPTILRELDAITWTIGGSPVSLRRLLESAVTAVIFLLVSLWVSSIIEKKLMAPAIGARPSVRKAIATTIRAVLLLIGLLVALNMAGIDLTALSVFGGALGVGIGLGLQRLAANYVSGFVLLTERVIRVGDVIRVNGFEGTITEMSGRYASIMASSGRQAIVPHEMLTNSMVEKVSTEQSNALQSTSLLIGHGNDLALAQQLMVQAAQACRRVLDNPAPFTTLVNVSPDGLELKLNYYIADVHLGGLESLRSEINLAVLKAFATHGVTLATTSQSINWDQLQALFAQGGQAPAASDGAAGT